MAKQNIEGLLLMTLFQLQCGVAQGIYSTECFFSYWKQTYVFALCRDSYDQYGFLLTSRERCPADAKFLIHGLRQQADKRQTVISTVNLLFIFRHSVCLC